VTWGEGDLGDKILYINPDNMGLDTVSGNVITPWGKVNVRLDVDDLSVTIPDGVKALVKATECLNNPTRCVDQGNGIVMIEGGGIYHLN
jgi:hypothetical protein